MKQYLRPVILTLVALHFLLGFLEPLPSHHFFWNLPVLPSLARGYVALTGFRQSWRMFSPPPHVNSIIKVVAITDSGWGPLVEPFGEVREKTQKSMIIPRGATRLLTFLRASNDDDELEKSRMRQFFYQQFSNYFCFGDGKTDNLRKIRFYVENKGMPRFYEKDRHGESRPVASDYDSVDPVYERDCSDI